MRNPQTKHRDYKTRSGKSKRKNRTIHSNRNDWTKKNGIWEKVN